MQHVYRLASAASAGGFVTCLYTVPVTADHPVVRGIKEQLGDSLLIETVGEGSWALRKIGSRKRLKGSLARWLVMRAAGERIPADMPGPLFVPWVEAKDIALRLLGSPFGDREWHGLTAMDRFHDHKMGIEPLARKEDERYERSFLRLLRRRTLKTLFTIDASLDRYVQSLGTMESSKVLFVPDPVELVDPDPAEARSTLGVPPTARVVLVFGNLEPRKNVAPLVRALIRQGPNSDVVLLLVGQQNREFKAELEASGADRLRSSGRMVELDSFVSKEEEYRAFAAANVVWLGYKNHSAGGSGILYSAAAAGKPTLATRQGILGWMARETDAGLLIGGDDVQEVDSALALLLADRDLYERCAANGRAVAARHETHRFTDAILDRLFSESTPR